MKRMLDIGRERQEEWNNGKNSKLGTWNSQLGTVIDLELGTVKKDLTEVKVLCILKKNGLMPKNKRRNDEKA